METSIDSSTAKDFCDSAPVVVSRHTIQDWRVAIWLHYRSRGRRMCFRGDKGFNMSTLRQSLQSKATASRSAATNQSSPFPNQCRKGDLKKPHISEGCECHCSRFTDKFRFQNPKSNWRASPERAQFQPLQTALNVMKSLASLILLATLTTMSGIRFA
jgi:hypothetical protein